MRAKILLAMLVLLLVGDALLWHGRYRQQVLQKAQVAEQTVIDQNWSSPMLD